MLERVCNKTEFEVEGWRKIPPLVEILEKNANLDLSKIELKMININEIITQQNFQSAHAENDYTKLSHHTIRDSWIFDHFFPHFNDPKNNKEPSKIAIYVNSIISINKNMEQDINKIPNHCVIVKGLAKFPKNKTVLCLELENNGGSEETKYIPVDHPFFEEVQIRVNKIECGKSSDTDGRNNALNRYGKELAEMKWSKLEKNWYDLRKDVKTDRQKNSDKEQPYKYPMLFVRGRHSCYQLKFTS